MPLAISFRLKLQPIRSSRAAMSKEIEVIYRNGQLELPPEVHLPENARVTVILPDSALVDPADDPAYSIPDLAEEIGPEDILLVGCLLLHGADEKPVRMSNSTISMALGCSESPLKISVRRLVAVGWIAKVSGKGRKNPNLYSVMIDKLPVADELKRTVISPAMRTLGAQYADAIKGSGGKKRRFTKANMQRMAFTLQTFLEKHCGGDENLLRGAVNFALTNPAYHIKARRGPHELRRVFKKLLAAYQAEPAQQAPPVAKPAPRQDFDAHPWGSAPLRSGQGEIVYKLQNVTAVGLEAFKQVLLSGADSIKESDGCSFFVVKPDGSTTEHRVMVSKFGPAWSLNDAVTGRDPLKAAA